jgi:hypothetical protein
MVIFIQDTQELAFPVAVMQSAMEANVAYYHEHKTPLNVLATIAKSALPIERAAALTAISDALQWDLPHYSESELRNAYTRLRQRYSESGEGLQGYGLQLTQKIGVILNNMSDSHVCQNCGGDDRVGSHWKQLDADWFYCEKGEDVKADYFEDDGIPF